MRQSVPPHMSFLGVVIVITAGIISKEVLYSSMKYVLPTYSDTIVNGLASLPGTIIAVAIFYWYLKHYYFKQ